MKNSKHNTHPGAIDQPCVDQVRSLAVLAETGLSPVFIGSTWDDSFICSR